MHRMKKSDYAGWKDVFSFSFMQGLREKSFKGFLIFSALLMLVGLPLYTVLSNKEEDVKPSNVEKLVLYNESDLDFDVSLILKDERYSGCTVVSDSTESYDDAVKRLEENEDKESKEILAKIEYQEEANAFHLTFVKSAKSGLKDKECQNLVEDFTTDFNEAKKQALKVTDEQEAFISQDVITNVKMVSISDQGEIEPEKETKVGDISFDEYTLMLTFVMVVCLLISFSSSSIATSIVTEKSTRVVEYLMINVRPMALIVGKILSNLLLVVIEFICVGICYGLSKIITNQIAPSQETSGEGLANALQIIESAGVAKMAVVILIVLVGVLFFCIVAGLAGASASKLEELSEALKVYNIFMIGGAYVSIGICVGIMTGGMNQNILNVASLIPIATPFLVPANLIIGKIGMGIALVSLIILIVVTAVLFSFTAKVYESLIFYNGSVMKLKDILAIAKNRKAGGKEVK